jgi:hypothetical protein
MRPQRAAAVLGLSPTSSRGIAETRAGLGGTYVALGLWSTLRGSADAYRAVGATWLGAATLRILSLLIDDPDTDWTYWAYLTAELVFGVAGMTASSSTARARRPTFIAPPEALRAGA